MRYVTSLNVAKLVAAVIMLQTLPYKFTAHPESVALFLQLWLEPDGRIGIGILELLAAILLFWPRYTWLWAVLTIGLMSGAIYAHVTVLGYNSLFALAVITWCCAWYILRRCRKDIPFLHLGK